MTYLLWHHIKSSLSLLLVYIMLSIFKLFRRRPIIYYTTLVVIFGILALAWTMILAQLSSNVLDESRISSMMTFDEDERIKTNADKVEPNDAASIESFRSKIIKLQEEIERLKRQQEQCSAMLDHVDGQVEQLKKGSPLSNEYEVHPFNHFTFTRIYPSTLGLGKRVVEKPIGVKRREIIDVLGESLRLLGPFNRSLDDFIEGLYSTDPLLGTQYHLYFRTSKKGPTGSKFYHKVTLFRSFNHPKIVANEIISTHREVINLILPINEDRLGQLSVFLENLRRLVKHEAGRLKLFIVYFGDLNAIKSHCCDDFSAKIQASSPPTKAKLTLPTKIIHVSNVSSEFSRAKALHVGADACCRNNSLLFFCDVDLIFTGKFLERCRLNASSGKKVYYPILFSLYNPKYSRVQVPNLTETPTAQLSSLISSQAGFWRDFGFGMTCQYKLDFLDVGGFDDFITSYEDDDEDHDFHRNLPFAANKKYTSGWGGEDVYLYRKHLQHPRLSVVRAIDPGVFHVWHEKHCDPETLSRDQYTSCLSTRAVNEASHPQLAHQVMQLQMMAMGKPKSSS